MSTPALEAPDLLSLTHLTPTEASQALRPTDAALTAALHALLPSLTLHLHPPSSSSSSSSSSSAPAPCVQSPQSKLQECLKALEDTGQALSSARATLDALHAQALHRAHALERQREEREERHRRWRQCTIALDIREQQQALQHTLSLLPPPPPPPPPPSLQTHIPQIPTSKPSPHIPTVSTQTLTDPDQTLSDPGQTLARSEQTPASSGLTPAGSEQTPASSGQADLAHSVQKYLSISHDLRTLPPSAALTRALRQTQRQIHQTLLFHLSPFLSLLLLSPSPSPSPLPSPGTLLRSYISLDALEPLTSHLQSLLTARLPPAPMTDQALDPPQLSSLFDDLLAALEPFKPLISASPDQATATALFLALWHPIGAHLLRALPKMQFVSRPQPFARSYALTRRFMSAIHAICPPQGRKVLLADHAFVALDQRFQLTLFAQVQMRRAIRTLEDALARPIQSVQSHAALQQTNDTLALLQGIWNDPDLIHKLRPTYLTFTFQVLSRLKAYVRAQCLKQSTQSDLQLCRSTLSALVLFRRSVLDLRLGIDLDEDVLQRSCPGPTEIMPCLQALASAISQDCLQPFKRSKNALITRDAIQAISAQVLQPLSTVLSEIKQATSTVTSPEHRQLCLLVYTTIAHSLIDLFREYIDTEKSLIRFKQTKASQPHHSSEGQLMQDIFGEVDRAITAFHAAWLVETMYDACNLVPETYAQLLAVGRHTEALPIVD